MAFPDLNDDLFECLAPEFESLSSTKRDLIAAETAKCFNEAVWGEKIEMGHVYLTAHTFKMAQRRGTGGAIASEKVGDLSRSYAQPQNSDEFDQTSYGKEYKRLLSQLVTSPFIATC